LFWGCKSTGFNSFWEINLLFFKIQVAIKQIVRYFCCLNE